MIAAVGKNGRLTATKRYSNEPEKITAGRLLRLAERQEYKCALTGRDLTPETAAVDHIVPLAKNGKHMIQNVQVLHVDVNRAKGTLTVEEFVTMCREVVRTADGKTST